jgi:hypothetical protein
MAWTTLMDTATGTFAVTTQSAVYLIDLDLRAVVRLRGNDPITPATVMRRDRELVDLIEIGECTVGRSMILLVDLHIPGVAATRRVTSTVARINVIVVVK